MTSAPRNVLVTGGGGGLGAATAARFAGQGDRVGVLDIDAARAREVAARLPGDAVGLGAAVEDPGAVAAVLDEFGLPDVVVNNAGIVRFGPLVSLPLADWQRVLEVNLTGVFVVSRTVAARWMAAGRGGTIVNVTSMNGVQAGPGAGAYGASKAAVALLTQQMALEWGASGIRVNAVAPGLIDGGMSEPIYADDAVRAARTAKVPLGRLGSPDDVADAVLWLASEHSAYVTGQQLLIDGGVTMAMIANLPRPAALADGTSTPAGPG